MGTGGNRPVLAGCADLSRSHRGRHPDRIGCRFPAGGADTFYPAAVHTFLSVYHRHPLHTGRILRDPAVYLDRAGHTPDLHFGSAGAACRLGKPARGTGRGGCRTPGNGARIPAVAVAAALSDLPALADPGACRFLPFLCGAGMESRHCRRSAGGSRAVHRAIPV